MITWNVFLTYHVCLTQPESSLLCIIAMIISIVYVVLVRSNISAMDVQQQPTRQQQQQPIRQPQQQPARQPQTQIRA